MNTALLLKIRARILAEPEHFDMAHWFTKTPCGTAACIAGFSYCIRRQLQPGELVNLDVMQRKFDLEKETKALGLDAGQAYKLFVAHAWPEPFRSRQRASKPKRRAEVAAERIDHFIATDGRE